jgi:hypothetical protein
MSFVAGQMNVSAAIARKPSRAKRVLLGFAILLLCAWLGFLSFIGWAMRQPPEVFGHVMAGMPGPLYLVLPFETMWTQARRGALQPGDPAPDFDLPTYDKSGRVDLAAFRGKQPVVLIFGSYT